MTASRRSLTFRLVSLFAVVIAALLIGLGWLTMAATDQHFLELDEIYLRDKAVLVQEIGISASTPGELINRIGSLFGAQTGLSIALFENKQAIYTNEMLRVPNNVQTALLSGQTGGVLEWQALGQRLRSISVPIMLTSASSGQTLNAVLTLDTEHHDHFMHGFRWLIWLYVALAIVAGGLLAWWAARKGLNPLRPIIKKTREISASQLSDRISTEDIPLELQPLTQTLNGMLERLEQDFSRLSDFSSDLAHELRTPISNMLVQTQVTLGKPRGVEQYQEALLSIVEELERLSHMVSDMLYLAKTEHHVEVLRPETIDLFSQAAEVAEFYELMADDKGVDLVVSGNGIIEADRTMVRRAISNLVSNAIKHARKGTLVSLHVQTEIKHSALRVSNDGDTIDSDEINRVFDRFYRTEKARTNLGSDGAGLGLAITRAIMTAHGGHIRVTSGSGTTSFALIFPNRQSEH